MGSFSTFERAAQGQLAGLLQEIGACRICRDAPLGRRLPHEPRPVLRVSRSARLAVCGQAPGTRAHASGIPFMDQSGVRLRAWMGVTDVEFYDETRVAIIPMGFCFPGLEPNGGDLPPRKECSATWHGRLFGLLPRIELILLVGQYAHAWHLGDERGATLTATVKAWRATVAVERRPRLLPLPHPSWRNSGWLKANPWFELELLPVLKGEVRRLLAE